MKTIIQLENQLIYEACIPPKPFLFVPGRMSLINKEHFSANKIDLYKSLRLLFLTSNNLSGTK